MKRVKLGVLISGSIAGAIVLIGFIITAVRGIRAYIHRNDSVERKASSPRMVEAIVMG